MLESHASKMKEMLDDKTSLLDELDNQNRAHLQEIGQLKRTMNEMESARTNLTRQHQYELENMHKESTHNHDTVVQQLSENENTHKQELK